VIMTHLLMTSILKGDKTRNTFAKPHMTDKAISMNFISEKLTSQIYRKGFTLMEMLIVIAIISVLLSLLYGALERAQKFSRRSMAYTEIKNIESAFKQYYAHYNSWPSNELAAVQLSSGEDKGFIIDREIADVLQGYRLGNPDGMDLMNPAAIPFLEFARYSRVSNIPVNPFKSINDNADDTTRAYKVLFDTNGDRQIIVPASDDTDATTAGIQQQTIVASIAVWTMIPALRTSDSTGTQQAMTDVILGSWDSFAAR